MKIKLYQDGGAVAPQEAPQGAPAGAPAGPEQGAAPEQGGDPLMQIAQIFAQGLQAQDCQALAQGAEMFLQLISQAQQGGGAEGGAPPPEPTVMKKGGKFVFKKKADAAKPADKVDMSKCGGKAKKK